MEIQANKKVFLKTAFFLNPNFLVYGNVLEKDIIPYIDGSDFSEKFFLISFHFHWGFNPYQGSEHSLNGTKYPLEVT
jgi:hypothetical protein